MTEWLTGTFFATSVLLAAVLIAREPVRRAFGPAVAYGLWLVPALRMLMPPLTQTIERVVPAVPPSTTVLSASLTGAEPGLIDRLGGWPALAIYLWAACAAIMFVGGILIYRWQRREVLRDAVQLAKLGTIRVVSSPAVGGPMAFGILDRVIALPMDFEQRFDAQERRLAFDHELAHHRSGDLIVSHIAFGMLCLQWFSPIAWLSHAAFRFDQEAACDARVLDKAKGCNRADYAQAIAKAASGRALLFAGALDRPRTLHRRLASMLTSPSSSRRIAGKAMIALTAAVALPLTASHATEYVDVQQDEGAPAVAASQPAAAQSTTTQAAAAAPLTPAAASAPQPTVPYQVDSDGNITLKGGVKLDKGSTAFFDDDRILIHGKIKTLDQLTPAERAELRTIILKSQRDLAKERDELPARLAEASRTLEQIRSGAFKREHLQDIADMQDDLAELAARSAELRAEGEDPAKRKAEILRDLKEAQSIDIDKEIAEAMRDANPAKISAELRSAEQQMDRMLTRLNQLDRQ